jgi:hypothetical protein
MRSGTRCAAGSGTRWNGRADSWVSP